MARFHPLTVTDIHRTIRDAVVVTLRPADDAGAAFGFVQGQYLTFRRVFDGEELRRSYSICAGRDDGVLQVAIKRVDGGAFSTWANQELAVGDTLEAMPPAGGFWAPPAAGADRHYLAFAGGSGITPILSIIKTALQREAAARVTLVYANRAVNTIMFREELEDLKNLHMGRLNIIHVLESDTQEIDLFTGLVTEQKCDQLFARWIDIAGVGTAYICGPEPMMLGIAAALRKAGLDESRIRFELFASAQPGRLARPVQSGQTGSGGDQTRASVTLDGASRSFTMAKDCTILEAALANSIDAPFACKAGVCSTCRCRLVEGEVDMIANHALEDYEVEKGYVLSCQSYPVSDRIVVDYDQ